MNLLAPLFLLGALAVAGPVLFHLIRRTTRERTPFGSVMFLRTTQPRLTRRSRLEHLLLLLLRCLALGLLALGFARPFFRSLAPAEGDGPGARRVVVLVDASAGMRRTGLWDDAKSQAGAALRALGPGDAAALLLFGDRVAPLVTFGEWTATPPGGRAALAEARLAAAAPGWGASRIGDALVNAAEALAAADSERKTGGQREIVLISDMKAGSRLESLQAFEWPKNIGVKTVALKARHPTNAGLELVAEAVDTDRMAAPTVRVRVSNAADSQREQFSVGWALPGNPAAGPAVDVYVPPGQSRVVAIPVPAGAPASGRLTLRGDDEDFDNSLYVASRERLRWSIVYLGPEAAGDIHGPLYFLERALPDNPRLQVRAAAFAPADAVPEAALREAKMIVVTDALPAATAEAVRSRMAAGATVLFAPRGPAAGPTLAALLGSETGNLEDVLPKDYAMFGDIDFRNPLFAAFADPQYSDFTKIHVWKYRRLKPAEVPGMKVIARFDSGDPALFEVPAGRGRLLALMTGWNPEDSQLAVSSKFVPLVYSMLELAGGPADGATQFLVGDPIPLRPGDGPASVVRPDGTTVTIPAGAASYAEARTPGIYTVAAGGRTATVAVNVPPSESRTSPLPGDVLERYGAPAPRTRPEAERAARRDALLRGAEAESRQKLWRWLLGAAILVLLAESALAGWTLRRNEATVGPGGMPS